MNLTSLGEYSGRDDRGTGTGPGGAVLLGLETDEAWGGTSEGNPVLRRSSPRRSEVAARRARLRLSDVRIGPVFADSDGHDRGRVGFGGGRRRWSAPAVSDASPPRAESGSRVRPDRRPRAAR